MSIKEFKFCYERGTKASPTSLKEFKFCVVHGTKACSFELINKNGFRLSDTGYFGSAVYFFPCTEMGRDAALQWAGKKADSVGICACIKVCPSHFIDLTTTNFSNSICAYHSTVLAKHSSKHMIVSTMKKFLHKICKKLASDRKVDYNECVIHSLFPAIDGRKVKDGLTCFAVKGSLSKISLCGFFSMPGNMS